MNTRALEAIGIPPALVRQAKQVLATARARGLARNRVRPELEAVVRCPADHRDHPVFGALARALEEAAARGEGPRPTYETVAPWKQWGDDIDPQAIEQMRQAMRLPVAVAGALMPDAHVGYGLPIGGVLATENAVVPYAVGVDIACRMKLSVFDAPVEWLDSRADRLSTAIENETRFGMGAAFGGRGDRSTRPRSHPVLDDDWDVSPVTKSCRDKARAQLGTSGSGNHFVEFGTLTVDSAQAAALGLASAGTFLALLSHSGSRGTGAAVCDHYSKLAMRLCPELPGAMRHLAWLSLGREEGREYWAAMQLMGRYAAANHAVIHRHVAEALGVETIFGIENHHNFAWEETHDVGGGARRVVVHRKGATPAAEGVLGIIPGSMAAPGFVVRGRGGAESLGSASHGAGRRMSRTKARESYRWAGVKGFLAERNVQVLSAGIDEVPHAYKDIHAVMAAQADLVETLGRFEPRLVKMAPDGERAED
ncbi:MAG: RtcB family protein [Planctomycetia bacterium]